MKSRQDPTIAPAIRAAVHARVKALQDAFNAHDAVALSGNYSEDAAWSTSFGQRLLGRQAIADFGREVMSFLANSYARYEIVSEVAIRPDVIAVQVLQTPTDAQGNPIDGNRASALYVIAETGGEWKIVAGSNTFIQAP